MSLCAFVRRSIVADSRVLEMLPPSQSSPVVAMRDPDLFVKIRRTVGRSVSIYASNHRGLTWKIGTIAALALAGCGSGDSTATATTGAGEPSTSAVTTAAPTTSTPAPTTTDAPTTTWPYTGRKQSDDCPSGAPVFDDDDGDGYGYCLPLPVTTVPPVPTMPSGDPVFAGYPLIVDISTIDRRVASWIEDSVIGGQVVAVAPGVYVAYNPNIPDLLVYLDGPNDGDCLMRDTYFPSEGGACWSGVQKGSAEP